MKNIAALALISSIALVSCKKETAKITKVDPKTGKTVTVEVPADSVAKVAENPAIRDSAGIVTQSFKLEKGKTYPLTTYQRDVKTMTDPQGKSITATSESTDEMNFTVNDIKGNVYDMTLNLVAKRSSQSAQGKTIVVDTKLPIPKEDELKMIWNINRALTGNKLEMQMDNKGNVLSIKGFDAVYTKVSNAVGTLIKDANEKASVVASLKESFNEKVLKDQFHKNLTMIPKKGVKVGEKWSTSESADPSGSVKVTSNYVLKSLGNGTAEIAVTGGIPKKTEKKNQGPITHSLSSELVQNGTIKFDENTGWITNQNINVKTTQVETISDGKQSQSMKSVSNSSVMVNPSAK
ncbi:DUF6263 family protein [Chryseobacterium arthrosphaerae]|uniref:DUF6263 family protein n=1 Tax=Chryseobacterium arthrosphaerae TaxID=651561 RepID=A0A1B8ZT58_9FLAO|nr:MULTISPECIES: DUF6263 family protein [Chryseobacterium]AYZ13209.1 hypothetical protein EGY05_15245 [Chryseobacterium arthrosphaerae]MDG4652044.1 DUF6263 family protein [Chryseobacterium arthrosphaerae]OCA74772.1 hypothetical protein BBI00_10690 [Chryseobacterium arthrosphaerae]UEQ78486.1 hypothetical protein J8N07_09370 [Chryseobacterium arthrosphaerae]WES99852.1 DUF6263 family protein [Chryseobacterium arthrosphaerae]